jgi:hypothetical protein
LPLSEIEERSVGEKREAELAGDVLDQRAAEDQSAGFSSRSFGSPVIKRQGVADRLEHAAVCRRNCFQQCRSIPTQLLRGINCPGDIDHIAERPIRSTNTKHIRPAAIRHNDMAQSDRNRLAPINIRSSFRFPWPGSATSTL